MVATLVSKWAHLTVWCRFLLCRSMKPIALAFDDQEPIPAAMFDARSMKLLAPGQYLISPDYPGLRFEATNSTRTWIYRYRRMADSHLWQVKIGNWPAMSLQAVVVTWEGLRKVHDAGGDPGEDRKLQRTSVKEAALARRPPVLSSWRSKFGGMSVSDAKRLRSLMPITLG